MKALYLFFASLILSVACQSPPTDSLKVLSINIRYDNPDDAPEDWLHRQDSLAKLVTTQQVDLIGTQEVLHNQLEDLMAHWSAYSYVGVGRLDGKTLGEYAPIWYLRERFELVEDGHFWLSETPDSIGSKGWDAACERIVTWAKLKDYKTQRNIFVINTHMDHEGTLARERSAELIQKRLAPLAKDLPIIFMGDLNAPPSDKVISALTDKHRPESLGLSDTRLITREVSGEEGTFHDFAMIEPSDRERIDYIFVNAHFHVAKHRHINTDLEKICLSDHNAVFAELNYTRP